jgi:hypothetical protein
MLKTAAPTDMVRVVATGARGIVIGFYDRIADSVLVLLDDGGLRHYHGRELERV